MNKLSKQLKMIALTAVSALIAACGGGDGVSIGTGQDPDPVVIDFPIAYIKSPIPTDANGDFVQQDLREQITFEFGADLYFRDRASPSAADINITESVSQGLAAVRDVEIDYDGSRLLFAMRVPFDPNLAEEDLPTWNIWQYTFATDELIRVIPSDLIAEIGHDIMPKFLPDGRIVFSSTRQTQSQAVLLDEGKGAFPAQDEDDNEFAFNLHLMDEDGTGIRQVSFNQSHDLDPSVLDNGQVVFSRWDHNATNNSVNLYRMNPDGSNLELLYGQQSHATGASGEIIQFMQPRQAEDGRVIVLARPFTDTEGGGDLIFIDTPQYLEITQPTKENIGVLTGPAQEDATINDVSTVPGAPSPGGRYFSVYPIQDGTGRLMVSWTQCRLIEILADDGDPNTLDERIVPCTADNLANVLIRDPNNPVTPVAGDFLVAPPLYGIWMYDPRDDTQLPIVVGEEGFMFTEVVSADPRSAPPVLLDGINNYALDATLAGKGEAVLNIRSIYDFDGVAILDIETLSDPVLTPAAARPARFLRIEKAVSQPDDNVRDIDNTAFGITTLFGMKEIVGYAMIEPDGSVMTKVPANTALMLSVVDENAMRITQRHENWISLGAGQELSCNGCHDANSGLSHGRMDAFDSAYAGAQIAGVEFPNTDPKWFVGEVGETMAEVRARITCADDGCSSLQPSMNVIYRDVWTADPVIAADNVDIDYLYTDLKTTLPTTLACQQNWQSHCRSVINYETIIHPLWSQPRLVVDDTGFPVLDGNGMQLSNNCLNCHTPIDPVNNMVRVPAGQLELQDGLSADEPDHFDAYRELLVTDNLQIIVNGVLVDSTTQVAPPASIAGARASSDFFDRFNDPEDLHFNILSGAELRLVAEWLDVGGQYYNNPFDAPAN
ncbi:MAG: PD40 domain-containing protein [Proteobacteria bacterium]|nr:PD40 domain-containing protein [Pseudomonadota bacterium]